MAWIIIAHLFSRQLSFIQVWAVGEFGYRKNNLSNSGVVLQQTSNITLTRASIYWILKTARRLCGDRAAIQIINVGQGRISSQTTKSDGVINGCHDSTRQRAVSLIAAKLRVCVYNKKKLAVSRVSLGGIYIYIYIYICIKIIQ